MVSCTPKVSVKHLKVNHLIHISGILALAQNGKICFFSHTAVLKSRKACLDDFLILLDIATSKATCSLTT